MQPSVQSVQARQVLQVDSTGVGPSVSQTIVVASALVVDPKLNEALSTVALLTDEGFEVTVAETFAKAKDRLNTRPPTLLVTEVRLGEYNGLHLVLRGKAQRRTMAALVMSTLPDPVLQTEAEAMGATFLLKPLDSRDLLAAVTRTMFQRDRTEGPVRAPFERRSVDRRSPVMVIGPEFARPNGERRSPRAFRTFHPEP
jgi:DNA-binding response OmpR family regulator